MCSGWYYEFTPEEAAAKDRYTRMVYAKYDEVIGQAIAALAPADLDFAQGLAGVAVNRRRSREPESRALGGTSGPGCARDHRQGRCDELKAILFGYSCHTTALGGLSINGDYAGFAQLELEPSFPGTIAMFAQNCGGDANPLPRIRERDAEATELARMYGRILAESVRQVVTGTMQPLGRPIRATMGETELELQPGLPLDELRQRSPQPQWRAGSANSSVAVRHIRDPRPRRLNRAKIPVQVWRFGTDLDIHRAHRRNSGRLLAQVQSHLRLRNKRLGLRLRPMISSAMCPACAVPGGKAATKAQPACSDIGHRGPYTDSVEERRSRPWSTNWSRPTDWESGHSRIRDQDGWKWNRVHSRLQLRCPPPRTLRMDSLPHPHPLAPPCAIAITRPAGQNSIPRSDRSRCPQIPQWRGVLA